MKSDSANSLLICEIEPVLSNNLGFYTTSPKNLPDSPAQVIGWTALASLQDFVQLRLYFGRDLVQCRLRGHLAIEYGAFGLGKARVE